MQRAFQRAAIDGTSLGNVGHPSFEVQEARIEMLNEGPVDHRRVYARRVAYAPGIQDVLAHVVARTRSILSHVWARLAAHLAAAMAAHGQAGAKREALCRTA